jgi:hypothetical protein
MKHFANPAFWRHYNTLASSIKKIADNNFELLKSDAKHPSLHLKKVDKYWSARIGRKFRAFVVETDDGLVWFWIGTHAEYNKLK